MTGAIGGSLLTDAATIDGQPSHQWIAATKASLEARGCRILSRTTAAGFYDHGLLNLIERLTEPGQTPGANGLAQRLWRVRAGQVVLATGALERPRLFAGNDLPGVMLSGAVRTYLNRFGVRTGSRVVITTDNDDAYRTALALAEAGSEIVAILDSRPAIVSNDQLAAVSRILSQHGLAARTVYRFEGYDPAEAEPVNLSILSRAP